MGDDNLQDAKGRANEGIGRVTGSSTTCRHRYE